MILARRAQTETTLPFQNTSSSAPCMVFIPFHQPVVGFCLLSPATGTKENIK